MTGDREAAVTSDLVEMNARPYVFLEHRMPSPGDAATFTVDDDSLRSYVVTRGQVNLRGLGGNEAATAEYSALAGWHAWGVVFEMLNAGHGAAVVLEAGVDHIGPGSPFPVPLSPLSDYVVTKPWGHEIWYTGTGGDVPYVLKQIHMTAGRRSSLQSHRFKAETNYVVDGHVTVLNGTFAPGDGGTVDAAAIPRRACGPCARWTSPPGMLHRVVAETDYTSIEVSTPELDDVVRWQDDTGRGNGRVAAEHQGRRP